MKFQLLSGLLFLTALSTTQAQLKWEKMEIELHPKAGDAEAVANFKYQNTGKTPIKITSVKSSCGCTAASSKKDEVAPGESGEVVATFKIGGRTGFQQKSITVETTDPAQPIANLMLKATIEQPVEIQPSFVFWQAGEDPKPKSVHVKVAKEFNAEKLEVSSSSPEFTVKLEKDKAPGEFNLRVTPKNTTQPANATLTLKGEMPQPAFIMARVIAPAAAASH